MSIRKDEKPENDFEVDKHRLDEEWEAQMGLFRSHARRLADARKERDLAEAEKDLVWAEIDNEVRADPERFGMKSASPKEAVDSKITVHPRYRKALLAWIDAKHFADVCLVDVNTMETKKKAIEDLVILQGRDYFAQPRVRGEDGESMNRRSARFGKAR